MTVVESIAAVLVVLSVLVFAMYLVELFRMPTGERPRTPTFNRFGEELPREENPGFRETEEETRE